MRVLETSPGKSALRLVGIWERGAGAQLQRDCVYRCTDILPEAPTRASPMGFARMFQVVNQDVRGGSQVYRAPDTPT